LIDKVSGRRLGSDSNKYLIAMWEELQCGWVPLKEISREFYSECRNKYNKGTAPESEWHIIGYVGFNGSYGGRFYDGGYAGTVLTKGDKERNYPLEAYRNVMKQIRNLDGVLLYCCDYQSLKIPKKSIIYCDIPYFGAKTYTSAKSFNHIEFWEWCRDKVKEGHTIYVSEYTAPSDFECIWEKSISSSLRSNGVISGAKESTERLFKLKGNK